MFEQVTQHYGLDSKSRWREAVCVMLLYSEPGISSEAVTKLGRQLAGLFRQDTQLWDVKAKQLAGWVERGLLNVKLLDRTLAYFQNQTSYLQYIKTIKRPLPRIESPGFPGTQWNEFYWKDQTVMLLMQEPDFPAGRDPEFCAKLFREEPGKWKLKMEQFKRWLEKGKNDPLPEYYGTGKNCAECGVFLWDTRSYLKHMKRNHGYKIKEKDKQFLKNEKREKQERREENNSSASTAPDQQDRFDALLASPTRVKPVKVVRQESQVPADSFDRLLSPEPSSSTLPAGSESERTEDSDLDEKIERKVSSRSSTVQSSSVVENRSVVESSSVAETSSVAESSVAPLRRRAANKPEVKDEIVSCPECGYHCLHSKIVQHLKRCTKKAAIAKKKAEPQTKQVKKKPVKKQEILEEKNLKIEPKMSVYDLDIEPEAKKSRESDIVKKVFQKKFQAQKNTFEADELFDEAREVADEDQRSPGQPPLKLRLSRTGGASKDSSFEVSKNNEEEDSDRPPHLSPKPEARRQFRLPSPDQTISTLKDESSDDEGMPEQSDRLRAGFITDSFKPITSTVRPDSTVKEDEYSYLPPPADKPSNEPKLKVKTKAQIKAVIDDNSSLKNKWLESLEKRNKSRGADVTPQQNKIHSELVQLKDKKTLINSKAKSVLTPGSLQHSTPIKESRPVIDSSENELNRRAAKKKKINYKDADDDELVPREAKEPLTKAVIGSEIELDQRSTKKSKINYAADDVNDEEVETINASKQKVKTKAQSKPIIKEYEVKEDGRAAKKKKINYEEVDEQDLTTVKEKPSIPSNKGKTKTVLEEHEIGVDQPAIKKMKVNYEERDNSSELTKTNEPKQKVKTKAQTKFVFEETEKLEQTAGIDLLANSADSKLTDSQAKDGEIVEYHDARPSLRRGKMIPCPICGVEYAIASNLQKHIEKDHFGETERGYYKRKSKEKDKSEPAKKKKKVVEVKHNEDDDDDFLEDLRPVIDNTTAEEKFDSLFGSPEPIAKVVKKVDKNKKSEEKGAEADDEDEKLTEYEIFQKLQLKESKSLKKKTECKVCGMMLPVNTIKRHLLKHEKEKTMENVESVETSKPKNVKKQKPTKKPPAKNKKDTGGQVETKKAPELVTQRSIQDSNDDGRIPCPQCFKMLPANAMKRHLMKHETVSGESDSEQAMLDVSTELQVTPEKKVEEKVTKGRKKIQCEECESMIAPNVYKRHLDKHEKMKDKQKAVIESYAPIEITPKKEYFDYNKSKELTNTSEPENEENSESDDSNNEDEKPPVLIQQKSDFENNSEQSQKSLKEVDKGKNSEEESESENPLESAVRKVVSYRMTPKQALSHYNLTPKVNIPAENKHIEVCYITIHCRFYSTTCLGRRMRTGCGS